MDKRILRERMRRKKRQLFIRKIIRLGACAVAVILVLVFLVKGIITPLVTKIGGGGQDCGGAGSDSGVGRYRGSSQTADSNSK